MRKKISIDRFTPRPALPEELRPDWLPSAAKPSHQEQDGPATERISRIAS